MGATSVTGTGPGESLGLAKPENNSGCCPYGKIDPETPPVVRKVHCTSRVSTGGMVKHRIGGSSSIRVCN